MMRFLMRRILAPSFIVLLVGCASGEADMVIDDRFIEVSEMSDTVAGGEKPADLFVEPGTVAEERTSFLEELKTLDRKRSKRPLYEQYVGTIGANGVLEGIEELWPKCHNEAHDLGKIVFDRVQNVALGLRICADGCYSGCMHGVLMEAFTGLADPNDPEGHVDPSKLAALMDQICYKTDAMQSTYSEGDCAHGIGHALMVLADYHVNEAMGYCDEFDEVAMRYYCATGAYMEYVSENDDEEASTKRALYPCDEGKYPAACMRYKMVHVIKRLVKKSSDVQKMMRSCNQLKEPYRIACYHGAGNGFMGFIAGGAVTLQDVCGKGADDERYVCIEGAMERMAKFHPERAAEVCAAVEGPDRATCDQAVENGMYDMEKDLSLYIQG